jgi:hypothetical protein
MEYEQHLGGIVQSVVRFLEFQGLKLNKQKF